MSLRRQWVMIDVTINGWRWGVKKLIKRAAQIASKHGISFTVRYKGFFKLTAVCHFEGIQGPTEAASSEFTDWVKHV